MARETKFGIYSPVRHEELRAVPFDIMDYGDGDLVKVPCPGLSFYATQCGLYAVLVTGRREDASCDDPDAQCMGPLGLWVGEMPLDHPVVGPMAMPLSVLHALDRGLGTREQFEAALEMGREYAERYTPVPAAGPRL